MSTAPICVVKERHWRTPFFLGGGGGGGGGFWTEWKGTGHFRCIPGCFSRTESALFLVPILDFKTESQLYEDDKNKIK